MSHGSYIMIQELMYGADGGWQSALNMLKGSILFAGRGFQVSNTFPC